MADEHTKSAEVTVAFVHYSLTDTLREQFPFMRTSLLEETVEATLTTLRQKVDEAKPQIEASKSRSSFYSLPAELRNHIYDLAFMPNEEGYFRANFNESAYPTERKGCYRATDPAAFCVFGTETTPKYPSLLLVSHQVRAEALPIFLSHLTVIVAADSVNWWPGTQDKGASKAQAWLRTLGPKHVKLVKKVVLKAYAHVFRTTDKEVWRIFGIDGLGLRTDAVEMVPEASHTWLM
ncbi:hypothetical protein PRZ48_010940 [Zasmidium cellare]|uniref:Uncharacterized protein n=1 Tax=Zasmidium cellare TaxID=395010 RepID=A0ABR0EA35_ZASCE|nr:hypothetical protein PRZ48_010940 [Zasmidium cellare]